MKKIIYTFGLIALAIIIALNLIFTANLDAGEHIKINNNSFIYVVGIIFLGLSIYVITEIINNKLYNNDNLEGTKKLRKSLFTISVICFTIFNIIWVIVVRPGIIADQIHACNIAQTLYNGNLEQFLPNLTYAGIPLREYMQAYHQQISLAFVFSLFFRIIHFDGIGALRGLNVIGNIAIIFALYKINKQISKKYKTNSTRLFTLIITFFSLSMLSTFIYVDLPGLALCLFSTYYMMKYVESNKIKYSVIASLFTMVAYMMRMNNLIFIIATVIYLLLDVFYEITKRKWKENLIKVLIIAMYVIVSIVPASLVKNYYLKKYEMDKTKAYPNISYILMAMEESWRGCGWYNEDRGEPALKDPEGSKQEYVQEIKHRLQYFINNPKDAIDFYVKKLASMWAENTYSAVRSNLTKENIDEDPVQKMYEPLLFYQKATLIVICLCSLIALVQSRKNLSIEVIFLLTIFLGGFSFHILWEAKSRYIIPYIVALIPISSICINKSKVEQIVSNIKTRVKWKKLKR